MTALSFVSLFTSHVQSPDTTFYPILVHNFTSQREEAMARCLSPSVDYGSVLLFGSDRSDRVSYHGLYILYVEK